MNKFHLFLLILLFIVNLISAQSNEWIHYSSEGQRVNSLSVAGNILWIGTAGGLVSILTKNDSTQFYSYQDLPSSGITTINANNGNIWFGTELNGLVRYDGTDFKIIDKSNSKIPHNYITSISFDSKGNTWIGTYDGVAKFDGQDWTIFKPDNSSLIDNDITSLVVDKNDIVWIGTRNKGINIYDGKNWSVFDTTNSILTENLINTIYIDENNNKFIIPSKGGIFKYNNGRWSKFDLPNTIYNIRDIDEDNRGNLWFASYGGILKFDGSQYTIFNEDNSGLPGNGVEAIAVDNDGNIWAGSSFLPSSYYLVKFNGSDWVQYNTNSSFSYITDYPIYSIAVDSNNAKWITTQEGIVKYKNNNWEQFNIDNSSIPSNKVYKIIVDKFNNKWMGTSDGLAKYDDSHWSIYPTNFSNEHITSISIDKNNHIWTTIIWYGDGTNFGSKLMEFYNSNWTNHTVKSDYQIGGNSIYLNSVYVDTYGIVWIASETGLIQYDGENVVRYGTSNSGLTSHVINDVTGDGEGNIWCSTSDGVVLYKNGDWALYDTSNSALPSQSIRTITIDKFDNKWISTTKGLVRYDNFDWYVYNETNSGLYSSQSILCITIDKNMDKWFGGYGDVIVYKGEKKPLISNKIILDNNYYLFQNYPNPFNTTTEISFYIKEKGFATITIFNVLGEKVLKILDREVAEGINHVQFNANNISSGVYFYQLETNNFVIAKKMILLK